MTSLFQNPPPQNQQQQIQNQQLNNNQSQQNQINNTQNIIDNIQKTYNLLNRNYDEDNLFKESTRENMKLNLNAFQNFLPKDSIISTKRIDQLYALTTNLKKNLEKKQRYDANLNFFLAKENINIQKIEKDISEIQSVIQTKYELPDQKENIGLKEKKLNMDSSELAIEQRKNSINNNLSYIEKNRSKNIRLNSLLNRYCNKGYRNNNLIDDVDLLLGKNKLESPKKKNLKTNFNSINSTILGKDTNNMKVNSKINMLKDNNIITKNNFFLGIPNEISEYNNFNLFDQYFKSLENYFRNKCLSPQSTGLQEITNSIQNLSENLSINRKSIYELLQYQISIYPITTNNILKSTIKYYEDKYYEKLSQYKKINDYKTKKDIIDDHIRVIIYSKFSNEIGSNNKNDLFTWGKIFYFIRCGFINECVQFINKSSTTKPDIILFSSILSSDSIKIEDYQNAMKFIDENDKINNPFRHACFIYLTKKTTPLNDQLLDDINDYIWFYLNLIYVDKSKYNNIFTIQNSLLPIQEFQKYIFSIKVEDLIQNSESPTLDYIKCLMSILLYEKALNYISQKKDFIVDGGNLYFILYQIGLLYDFIEVNNKEITKNELYQNQKYSSMIKTFIPEKLYEVILYIRFSEINYTESIANIFRQIDNFDLLLDYNQSNRLKNDDFLGERIQINKIISEQDLQDILSDISNLYTSSPIQNIDSFYKLLNLLKNNRLYSELLNLLIFDAVSIIKQKSPQKIFYNNENRFDNNLPDRIISTNYKLLFEDINSILSKNNLYNNENFSNFKYLRQLETIEEVYDLININQDDLAYDKFMRIVTIVQIIPTEIENFINSVYKKMNKHLLSLYPDICYVYFYLLKNKILGLNNGKNNNREFIEMNKQLLNDLFNLISYLSSLKSDGVYTEKYNSLMNEINEFNHQI